MFPLVRDLAAARIPVAVACRVLGFTKQAHYKWAQNPVSQRDWDDAHLINAALDIHADDPEFGYRFIADELDGLGFEARENRVQRLCPPSWSACTNSRLTPPTSCFRRRRSRRDTDLASDTARLSEAMRFATDPTYHNGHTTSAYGMETEPPRTRTGG